ncbi:hypothetical protein Tco_0940312 [Tanacetum coccineum]|uniref:Copia protein n=1 Tax=Tanacetum coccineum TaxID=301880 RepID=A0ABQ5DNE0_9ASTR
MEFKSARSNTTAKLPIIKLGEYEMWVIRIKQCFQVQDYALWEVIENGNSWVSVPQTAQENGTSITKMSVPVTAEERTNKKNDVKLQKIVSRLVILGVVITQEDLNSKILESLPPEWNTHVVVWMNKADIEIMSIDDLYNNFKIVEQDVKKSVGASSGAQNLAFMTAPSTSSTNDVNTANPAYEVSIVSPNINTTCPQDLEQIHEDDLEAMDLKWQLSLLSMRAKRFEGVTISTTEAEYVSAGKACQQALWMKQALIDYNVRLDDVPIMCDNKGAIDLSKNPVQHSRTKHIEIRHHFLRDNVQKGHISIEKVPSVDNIADVLTKPLKRESFNYRCLGLGMMEHIP